MQRQHKSRKKSKGGGRGCGRGRGFMVNYAWTGGSAVDHKYYMVKYCIREGHCHGSAMLSSVPGKKEDATSRAGRYHDEWETPRTFPRFRIVFSCPHCPTRLTPTGHPSSPNPPGMLSAGSPASEAGTVSTSCR